jgi:hypothetical protein
MQLSSYFHARHAYVIPRDRMFPRTQVTVS